jgi:hypothetical protein
VIGSIHGLVLRWRHRNFLAEVIFGSEAPNERLGCR